MSDDRFSAFAHRGASLLAPENTEAAFREAVNLGYHLIETDIQASADGTLFVFHDDTLERMTGEKRPLGQLYDQEISELRIKGTHPIPKLLDMMEAFPEALFNIDVKTWPTAAPLAEFLQQRDFRERVCIGSFSDGRTSAVTSVLGRDTCHSLGTRNSVRWYLGALFGIPQKFSAQCAQLPLKHKGVPLIMERTIAYAHRNNLKLHIWTVNDAPTMHRLIDLGVDGIMSDDCVLLKTVLTERGLWVS